MVDMPWILSSPLIREIILPFLLVFVLIFAILDRSKILGEDKRQINALISLAISLIFVSFANAVHILTNLIPFLGIAAVVILIFFILFGFIASDKDGLKIGNGIKIAGGIIVLIALIIAVLVATDTWVKVVNVFNNGGQLLSTIIFIAIIVGAVAIVLAMGPKKG